DHHVEFPVIDACRRRDERAVAVLPSVGDRDEQHVRSTQFATHRDRILVPRAPEDLVAGNFEIATEAATHETRGGELMRDPRVEADAGEIEEEPALDLARIDHAFVSAERDLECRMRIERNAEFTREPVAGPTRDDP